MVTNFYNMKKKIFSVYIATLRMTLNLIFLLKLVITFKSKRLPILYRALGTNMVMTIPNNITPTPFTINL